MGTREIPDQFAALPFFLLLPPCANITLQLNMGPRCEQTSLGLCKSCTYGKRTAKDTQHTWRKQPTACILLKTTRANWWSSTARKTGFKHEASLTCCWLKISHEPTARHTQRMTLMTSFIVVQQLENAVHIGVLCTHHMAESSLAACSPATALGHLFFPNQKGIFTLYMTRVLLA